VISDLPSEASLVPAVWGEIVFEEDPLTIDEADDGFTPVSPGLGR
jgi:hypothetical protein